jgi:hypothetical protein
VSVERARLGSQHKAEAQTQPASAVTAGVCVCLCMGCKILSAVSRPPTALPCPLIQRPACSGCCPCLLLLLLPLLQQAARLRWLLAARSHCGCVSPHAVSDRLQRRPLSMLLAPPQLTVCGCGRAGQKPAAGDEKSRRHTQGVSRGPHEPACPDNADVRASANAHAQPAKSATRPAPTTLTHAVCSCLR